MTDINPVQDSIDITLRGVKATQVLAQSLARLARRGDVIALYGPMGAGKTTFARAFIQAWSGREEEVLSPAFSMVHVYEYLDGDIYHFDFKRLDEAEKAFELGIEEAFAHGLSLIESPERLGSHLPRHRLDITLSPMRGKTIRAAHLTGHGDWQERLRESGHA